MSKYFILAFIFLINFFLASKMILAGDFFFLADQARDFILTKDIITRDHFVLIGTHSGLGGFFHGPLWLYMLVPFYFLGGGNPFTFTYFYIAISVLTVIAGYFAASRLYDYKVGLLTAFLLALSPSIWGTVPNTIGVNMVPLVYIAMFYFLIKYIRGDKFSYIFAVFFAGLALQFETALPLIILPLVAVTFFLNKKAVKDIKLILLSIASFLLSISTFILFDLRHNFLMTRSLAGFVSGGEKESGYMELSQRILTHASSLASIYRSLPISTHILLLVTAALIVVISLYLLKKDNDKKRLKEWLYLALFPVFVMVLYLGYAYPVWPEYLLGLSIPIAFAFAISLNKVLQHKKLMLLPALFIILSLTFAGQNIKAPYGKNLSSGSYQRQIEVVEYIFKDAKDEKLTYFVYTPHTYTYSMDYLFEYLGEKKYGYIPQSNKSESTYLILYPQLSGDEGAHIFWKENVINTQSSPSASIEFESGIVVEKIDLSSDTENLDPNYHQDLIFR